MSKENIVINQKDNVSVCLTDSDKVSAGHKLALKDIKKGEFIIKYGEIIGRATCDVKKGEWVHSHNLSSHLDEDAEYFYNPKLVVPKKISATFKGYKRKVGNAGIRNEIYIIPTVGCINNVVKKIENLAQQYIEGSVDGVYAFTHQFGCSQLGIDGENIKKLLCSIALNPNASFVLFVGLGCENNSLNGIKEYLKPFNRDNIEYFNCQEVEDEVNYGLEIVKGFIKKASLLKREEVDFSQLTIGLKCGGSDGFSGITANPKVGKVTDMVVARGGSAVLTEVPEMFGAEHILMNKCSSQKVFESYKNMIQNFKAFYKDNGFPVYENPSPGNKKGGITTLEEKSLGCIEKAGSSPINDVLEYGDLVKVNGVSVLNAPGNDLVAGTALCASGCQIVLFTTGRGTPFTTAVPTMKIATNQIIKDKKSNWIDFDGFNFNEQELFEFLVKVVNGEVKLKTEDMREIAFYKTGVTL